MSRKYYILEDNALPMQTLVDRLEEGLETLRKRYGMVFTYSFTEDTGITQVHIWLERTRKQTIIRLVDDHDIPVIYLLIEATTEEELAQIGATLSEHLPFVPLEKLQQQAELNMANDPRSLLLLALGTGETFDQTTFDILLKGLHSSDTKVRYAAIMGAGITQWPEFVPELTILAQTDPVPDIREMAA